MAAAVGTAWRWPSLCYAAEKAEAQAAQRQLAKLDHASTAFRLVAKALRPSVVSIRATKIIKTAGEFFRLTGPRVRTISGRCPRASPIPH